MPKYTDYKRDEDGDRAIESGSFVLVHDIDVVRQLLISNVKLMKNDWFTNLDEGVLYLDNDKGMLGSNSVSSANEGQIIAQINNTTGVQLIEEFESSLENSKYSFNAKVLSEFGTIEINETIGF